MFDYNQDDKATERLWQVMEKTLNEATKENRRKRRWGIFFKLITFLYLLIFLVLLSQLFTQFKGEGYTDEDGELLAEYTALIDLKGTIAPEGGINADNVAKGLGKAYKDPRVKGIILRINSGGGSPVQSGYIYDEINRLRLKYPEKKLYAVIMEIGASGAYYIAANADEIYADKASLVGSIGVIGASFGFVEAMEKLGVERRLYASGEHKAFLDPFSPKNEEETLFWQEVLGGVHHQFIEAVKEGRGERLDLQTEGLFSGLIWNGEQALKIGLVDGLGSAGYVAREVIKAPHIIDFTAKEDRFDRLLKRLGSTSAKAFQQFLTEFSWQ